MNNQPIGIFDSGVGGLTVLKEIHKLLPNESIIYLGDTARVPYGNKSKDTIIRYSIENTKFLLKHKIKLLVVACNTSSSYAINVLQKLFRGLHIIGVVIPGAKAAVEKTKNNRVGIIGTKATIRSNAYTKAIKKLNKNVEVISQATPLFVPLIEEGWVDKVYSIDRHSDYYRRVSHENILRQLAAEYLTPLKKANVDVLVLGCTHYPAIKSVIQDIMGRDVCIIDSSEETAKTVKEVLQKQSLLNTNKKSHLKFYVTDDVVSFKAIGSLLLGKKIKDVKKVNIY
ncbi:MAG: glutamate racemase [Endomicrobia bacterium]|nr:glutamate racemase [Endomicrobiia bacterium]